MQREKARGHKRSVNKTRSKKKSSDSAKKIELEEEQESHGAEKSRREKGATMNYTSLAGQREQETIVTNEKGG